MQLDDGVIRHLKLGRVFKDAGARINSADFHRTEPLMAIASDDNNIYVYNTHEGKACDQVPCKKYGAAHITFTHSPHAVVHASNKGQDERQGQPTQTQQQRHALRYLDLPMKSYKRYLVGHTDSITSLSMCPKSDLLLSAAQDKTVRLWDIRTDPCQAVMHSPGLPVASFDQQGLVFAVAADSGVIKLYDLSAYDKGPFDTFLVEELRNSPLTFSCLRFSQDGKLLLAVVEGRVYVLDAFDGRLVARFPNGTPEGGSAPEASFSYDGQYVLSGCQDNAVRIWSVASQQEVMRMQQHPSTPLCVKWAPRQVMFASACQAVCLWIPDLPGVVHQHQLQHHQQQQPQQQQHYGQQQPAYG